ncbi:LAFE_0F08086g1_1 [Lachancea fermentati]|uniref:Mitochondrial import inner membrane translocase subunit TIM54 n=1 Tax=Lachancea fermentati TaxID=4955 RepID=A0A1G4MFF0_LACFM|nr:LAFE_0F08086g1_1 [Lachancea fermentati]
MAAEKTEQLPVGSNAKPKSAGFTNPAFRAMGLPAIRLPSRNWMIFWTLLTVSVSGVAYDKYKQKQIRKRWCDLVAPLAQETFPTSLTPRKVTVFVAPPPNDYLDTSMVIWRRFIKPVLFSSGIDYEVFTESRQGLIRFEVAERIRELRRELLDHEQNLQALEEEAKRWNKLKKQLSQLVGWGKSIRSDEEIDEEKERILAKKYKADFDYKELLGVFMSSKLRETSPLSEDALVVDPKLAGGVICLGRGAYKEYIAGLHEGILGPLDPPVAIPSEDLSTASKSEGDKITEIGGKVNGLADNDKGENSTITQSLDNQSSEPSATPSETNESQEISPSDTDEEDDQEKSKPIPKPYIFPDDYSKAIIPFELSKTGSIKNPRTHVPALFEQPILVIPIPHLIGFTNIPERIYRFYRRRYQAEAYCQAAVSCVLQTIRPFDPKFDLDLGKSEEEDWPKKWVQLGKEKKSEWVQELRGDERILKKLNVFDHSNISKLELSSRPNSESSIKE